MTWMNLRYAGTCKVCGATVAKGERGFYDRASRRITCSQINCAKADGLTEKVWAGSPVSGKFVDTLSNRRIGQPYVADVPSGYEDYEPRTDGPRASV